MKFGNTQKQSMGQGFAFQTRLANMLEMPGKEYAELIREIESDPLFKRLKEPQNRNEKAIRMRRLKQTDLSRKFFELNEDIAPDAGGGSAEVENLLKDKEKLIKVIRRSGEENFKKYFIFNEEELSAPEIAKAIGLTAGEVTEIQSLVSGVDVLNEFFIPSTMPQGNLSYNKVAVIEKTPKGFGIKFNSAHWARGLYDIDYQKIDKLIKDGRFSQGERKELTNLLKKIELLNIRKSLMHNIISAILKKQAGYLEKKGERGMAPFLQSELAKTLGVHPSIVSRAISGRSIETPWGEEKPLKEFFVSDRPMHKNKILNHIKSILRNEENASTKPLSDRRISELLKDKFQETIAPRTAAKYRNEMKVSSSFHRKSLIR